MITSKENKRIKEYKKLTEKKYREKNQLFLIEGINLVLEAYKNGCLLEIITLENKYDELDVEKVYVTDEILKFISDLETPYDIIGVCKYKNENVDIGKKLLILDNIQNPGNLGTIIRSAVAFDLDTIILSKNSVDLYNSKVLRGCQGMNFHINIIRKDIKEFIKKLKKQNFYLYGTNVNNGKDLKSIKKQNKYAIIVGNEGNGVSKEIQDLCDENICIKMNQKCESLNVGVASSIILYEINSR